MPGRQRAAKIITFCCLRLDQQILDLRCVHFFSFAGKHVISSTSIEISHAHTYHSICVRLFLAIVRSPVQNPCCVQLSGLSRITSSEVVSFCLLRGVLMTFCMYLSCSSCAIFAGASALPSVVCEFLYCRNLLVQHVFCMVSNRSLLVFQGSRIDTISSAKSSAG